MLEYYSKGVEEDYLVTDRLWMAEKEGDPTSPTCTCEKQIIFSFQVGKVELGPFLSFLPVLVVLTPY